MQALFQAHMNGYNLNKDRVEVVGEVDPYKIAQDEFKKEYSVKILTHLLMTPI